MNIVFLLSGFAEQLRSWFTGLSGAILSIVPKIIYSLCTLIFNIMDILQLLVRKVAGLDKVYYTALDYGTTGAQTDDIAFGFIKGIFSGSTPILSNIFWAMIILGTILLFLTTLVAIFRSEYAATDAKSASKGRIIGQSFKAIFSFAIVPIVAFFGMYLANVILQAIDSVTTSSEQALPPGTTASLFEEYTTGNNQKTYIRYVFYGDKDSDGTVFATSSTPISGQIFTASAYKANRIRFYTLFRDNIDNPNVSAGVFNQISSDPEAAATLLDNAFSNSYTLKTEQSLTAEPFKGDYLFPLGGGGNNFFSNSAPSFTTFDKNNISLVWYYYDLWSFNFIVCIAALVVCGKVLIDLVFGLMKRIFELIVLFLIAAPIASLMPLDNGAALGNWRKKFISKAIGTYAPILGLNLVFIILPLISTIKFFAVPAIDYFINVLFLIVGLLAVKDLVATIAELIGGDDTLKSGEGMASSIGQTAVNVGKAAVMPGRLAVGATKALSKPAVAVAKKVQRRRDHLAEEGAVLDNVMQDEEQSEKFGNLSGRQQRRFLKDARLNMSDSERATAHKDKRAHIKARKSFSNSFSLKLSGGTTASQPAAEQSLLEGAVYTGLTQERAGRLIGIGENKRERFQNASARQRRRMVKNETRNLSPTERNNILKPSTPGFKAFQDLSKEGAETWGKEKSKLYEKTFRGKISNRNENFKNFNANYFGAPGTQQRAQSQENIARRKQQEAVVGKAIVGAGKEIGSMFKDTMGMFSKTLGGEFAKGWKEAGGWGTIASTMVGISEKKQGLTAEVKNQKKILSAQDAASKLLGQKKSSGSSSVDISDKSISKLADQLSKKIKDK